MHSSSIDANIWPYVLLYCSGFDLYLLHPQKSHKFAVLFFMISANSWATQIVIHLMFRYTQHIYCYMFRFAQGFKHSAATIWVQDLGDLVKCMRVCVCMWLFTIHSKDAVWNIKLYYGAKEILEQRDTKLQNTNIEHVEIKMRSEKNTFRSTGVWEETYWITMYDSSQPDSSASVLYYGCKITCSYGSRNFQSTLFFFLFWIYNPKIVFIW